MRGLALEGGGARGAYHIGVVKAFMDNGYSFDGYIGTSIGAINAAVFAQGDFDLAMKLWSNISMEQLFDIDEQVLLKLAKLRDMRFYERIREWLSDKQLAETVKEILIKSIGGKGIDTSKMKALLETYLSEERIRKSGKDFGLVTVSISERKPYELMLEDIPQGQLLSYIMASASFPGFRPETIDDKVFIDGAFYDNCPINLLLEKGYDEVIAVRTYAPGVIRKPADTERVSFISPSEDLGNLMWFMSESTNRNIGLGYEDGLGFIRRAGY